MLGKDEDKGWSKKLNPKDYNKVGCSFKKAQLVMNKVRWAKHAHVDDITELELACHARIRMRGIHKATHVNCKCEDGEVK